MFKKEFLRKWDNIFCVNDKVYLVDRTDRIMPLITIQRESFITRTTIENKIDNSFRHPIVDAEYKKVEPITITLKDVNQKYIFKLADQINEYVFYIDEEGKIKAVLTNMVNKFAHIIKAANMNLSASNEFIRIELGKWVNDYNPSVCLYHKILNVGSEDIGKIITTIKLTQALEDEK